jgi:hypothetical protein
MTCIHGLDEINCPNCRVLKSTMPLHSISAKKINFPSLFKNAYQKNKELKKDIFNEIATKDKILSPLNLISKPHFINESPNFRNELFLKRFKDLDIIKEDIYGFTKKIPLENPEWYFEKEE